MKDESAKLRVDPPSLATTRSRRSIQFRYFSGIGHTERKKEEGGEDELKAKQKTPNAQLRKYSRARVQHRTLNAEEKARMKDGSAKLRVFG
jgi:hypothetical protein